MAADREGWLAAVQGSLRERRLDAGQHLFRQCEPVFGIFKVEAGRIRMVRYALEGTPSILHVAGPGDTMAEAALFCDRYQCDGVAEMPSLVHVVPKEAMLAALAADTKVAAAFMAGLADQVQSLRTRLEIRNIRSAPERVRQHLLLQLSPGTRVVEFDRPFKDVAAEIGLTHETFYRALATLESQGAIVHQGRTVTVAGTETRDGCGDG